MNNTVTFIMVAHNEAKNVLESLNSILRQTNQNFDLVFVDDCSTDGTFELVQSVALSHWKILRNREQIGSGASRNLAIATADTEWVIVQDADDVSVETRVSMVLECIANHEQVDVIGGQLSYYGSAKARRNQPSESPAIQNGNEVFGVLANGQMPTPHPSAALRRAAVLDVGGYSHHPRSQDLGLFIRLRHHKWLIDPRVHVLYRRAFITGYRNYSRNWYWYKKVVADELGLDVDVSMTRLKWLKQEVRRVYRTHRPW